MTSKRELAQEILMLTSEASTLGSNESIQRRQGLKGRKEDGGPAGQGRVVGVSTGQDWFFGKAKQRVGHRTVDHHWRAAIKETLEQDLSSKIAPLMASVGSTDLGYSVSIRIQ